MIRTFSLSSTGFPSSRTKNFALVAFVDPNSSLAETMRKIIL